MFDAGFSLAQRWYSARIGEGLILDLRTRVFDHVQRMPLAFFTRTQTGALISRLNNDVIGAQQAFTSTLSGVVSNVIALVLTAGVMFSLSWQITALSLVLLPVFVLPARRIGRRLQAITRESYGLNASMNATMTERFNVAGALLVKLFGRPAEESRSFADRAGRVRDIGVTSAMYARTFFVALTLVAALAQALVYGLGGYYALTGRLDAGTVVTLALLLTRLYGPLTALSNVRVDVMSALVSFDRVFEVLDLAPMIAEKPDAATLPAGARSIEFDDVRFSYPTADEVSLASLEDVAALDQAPTQEVLHGVTFTAAPGELVALVGPSGAGKTTISQLVPRIYDVRSGAVRVGGLDVRDVTLDSLHAAIGVVTQDAHLFHDTIRANLRYARPDATEDEMWSALAAAQVGELVAGAAGRAGDRGRRPRLPAVRRREAAAGDRPAAAQGARDRDPRRGDRAPGLRVRGGRAAGAGRRAGRPHLAGHRAPAVHRAATPTRSSWSTPGGSSRPARTASCSRPAGCTPSSTAPSSSARRRPARHRTRSVTGPVTAPVTR